MKQLLTLIFIFSIASLNLVAQLNPCGTPSYRSDWLKAYQKSPESYDTKNGSTLYVPLTIHLVTFDGAPGGAMDRDKLFAALCTLNEDFLETEIQFYIKGDIRILESSEYNDHPDVLTGAEMMFANNVTGTINTYFVDNPAGNCGYNLPYAGIAMNETCSDPDDHTWSHEIGHNLSVQHPFLGWEGGVSHDGSVPHSFASPAPEYVTYDYTYFKDTLILDTLIIDTILVEKVDGSNCHIAGDGFCDTSPDYIANRWDCNEDLESPSILHDPDNVPFRSDASLIMGYADDACSYRFTPEQIDAMRANLLDEKPELLEDNYQVDMLQGNAVTLDYPIHEETVYNELVEFAWDEVEGADYYKVIFYNTNPIFPGQLLPGFSEVVETNVLTVDYFTPDNTYVWEVEAMSNGAFCDVLNSEQFTFHATNVSSTINPDLNNQLVQLSPNATPRGNSVLLEAKENSLRTIEIIDSNGKKVDSYKTTQQNFEFKTQKMTSGLYLIRVVLDDGRSVIKQLAVL